MQEQRQQCENTKVQFYPQRGEQADTKEKREKTEKKEWNNLMHEFYHIVFEGETPQCVLLQLVLSQDR